MSMFLVWLILCGIVVNAWLGWYIGKAVGYCIVMFVYAVSYTRWSYSVGKVHGFRETKLPIWALIPYATIRQWWYFIEFGGRDVSVSSRGGVWKGVGDWTVFPVSQEEEPNHDNQ